MKVPANIEVKIEEGEDSLSKLHQALLIVLNSHPGCSVADYGHLLVAAE